MKKKMISMLLCMTMTASLMAGCAGGSTESGASGTTEEKGTAASEDSAAVELTMYHSWGEEETRGAALYKVVDQFNQENKGKIHINVDINNDFPAYQEKCKTMISTDTAPDIFHYNFNPNDLSRQESGKLLDFSSYMDEDWAARFGDGDLETLTINGELTSIPFEKAGAVWYYNTSLFEQAGIESFPKTWDEMFAACDKLEAIGVAPFTLYTANDAWYTCNLLTYIAASFTGTETLNAGGSLNTEDMVKAVELLRKCMNYTTADFVGADYSVASSNFVAEKTAMVIDGSWFIGTCEPIKDHVAIADAPTFGDGVVESGFLVTDAQTPWACGKTDDPKKAEAIVEFMKYVTSEEATKQLTLEGGIFLSAKLNLTDEEKANAGELMASYIDVNSSAPGSVVNLQRNLSTEANAMLPSLLEGLALDTITAEEFVTQLDSANNE